MTEQRRASKFEIVMVFAGIAAAMASYFLFNRLTPLSEPLHMNTWVDQHLPIVPVFVVPYLSFHVLAMVVVPVLSLKAGGRQAFLTNGLAIIIGQLILDVAYLCFQTEVPRVPVKGNDPFTWLLVHVVYGNDRPLNGFPSNHVTWSVISIIALWRLRTRIPRTSRILGIWFLLIIPATVLLRQHYVIDIYGGILAAFTAYWLCMFRIERPNLELPTHTPTADSVGAPRSSEN
jgi:membrane-associated phospholipid phosphatase